ncbi:MAG TPA: GNAT family N-acetyltransferase [Gaiellaceae bacterium]|nr:GNAT family N-acetyltransferase [Gaiellaceae bacterium]
MSVEIRTASRDERLDALQPIWHYFGTATKPGEERANRVLNVLPEGRMHVATDNGSIVGGAGAFQFELTVPGGSVRTAGVTVVGVLPSHRRRGILREMMRAQLDDIQARGEPLAALWASEASIYRRYGYGLAALCGDMNIPRTHSDFVRPVERKGNVRIVGHDEALALCPPVYDQVCAETPGMFARTLEWWKSRVLDDPEWRRFGGGELSVAVLEADGRPQAYALYRLNFSYEDGVPTGKVVVLEAMGAEPEAEIAVWRFLLDIDWMASIEAELLPLDHPLLLLAAEPGRLRFRVGDGIFLRIVDVGAALAGRSFATDDDLVLEVADTFCPWNDARFTVRGQKTMEEPDLRLPVDTLGSVYLGGFTFRQLARVGRVEEVSEGALDRADALFRSERAPWCPEIF